MGRDAQVGALMAVPTDVIMDRDPHTAAKHRILGNYLSAYFPIMASQFSGEGICFVDAFAGPGVYTDGGDGSPVIALGAASRPDVISTGCSLDFVFIEEHPGRLAHLKVLLAAQNTCFGVHMRQGRCEDLLELTLEELGLWRRAMFVNLDGWGVDTPFTLVERIGENKRRFLVDEYRRRLAECGFEFQLTFELTDEGGHSLFLVYGTSSIYGVRKMKDAMWSVDTAAGSKFRDPRDPNQMAFGLSEDSPDLRVLKTQILEQLSGAERISLQALKDFALRETVYKEVHATAAVKELGAARRVDVHTGRTHAEKMVSLAPLTLF
jgi:hypothetical protein